MLLRPPYNPKKTKHHNTEPCWIEMLQTALDGLVPSGEHLEAFLDRYERMP